VKLIYDNEYLICYQNIVLAVQIVRCGVGNESTCNRLDRESVSEYWHSISAPLARLFETMRQREYWLADSDEANGKLLIETLEHLVARFEDDSFVALLDDSEKSAVLAQVLSCADMPLFVRTLVMMDEKRAGIVSRLAHAMAKVSGEPEIFVNLYFERMQVVLQASMRGQVFSVQRIKQMAETMKYIQEGAL